MKRTGIRRKPGAKGLTRKTPLERHSCLKRSRPRTTPIRQSANGETCTLRLPGVCCGGTETTVWAHSNRSSDGKAKGLKARDDAGAYACYWCHMVYDRQHPRPPGMTLEFVEARFTAAMRESRRRLDAKGLISADPYQATDTE
ncbi:nuclease domain-containing protein [Paraburkholderia sp. MM6662-R1]|uniref:nuclease domain-containing protein n=1 Tax=Paraburkholderia sp. MM6662-R1 TaxID=2991066 RepID=UPI003D203B70